jgi:Kef-type K+ transport system membrane component KefB
MRVIGLLVVLLLATIVQQLSPLPGAREGEVALAVGIALIAAVLLADVVERFAKLPRVTGYLLLGLICGPYVLNLITESMARELRLFNGLAVALIAFIAGLEMNLAKLRPRLRAIASVSGVVLGVMYVLLAPVLWLAWPWLPIAPEATGLFRVALALVLTVIVISFSPTVTIAVIAENRARGPFTELVLAVVIFGDLVLILSFAFVMQLTAWSAGITQGAEVGFAAHLAWEILGSLAFGATLGALFAIYLQAIGREITLALLALCGVLSIVGSWLTFEPLLAALAAGLVVENIATPRGDALRVAVERGALPVLVLFFATAGASLNLGALGQLWIATLGISALRFGSMRLGTAVSAAMTSVRDEHARRVWMGLVSQAGVTLGLSVIVAAQYPTWGVQMQTLVIALVTLHEVIGPVIFRAGLARAKEIGKGEEDAGSHELAPSSPGAMRNAEGGVRN